MPSRTVIRVPLVMTDLEQTVDVPAGARVVHAAMSRGAPTLYFDCDLERPETHGRGPERPMPHKIPMPEAP